MAIIKNAGLGANEPLVTTWPQTEETLHSKHSPYPASGFTKLVSHKEEHWLSIVKICLHLIAKIIHSTCLFIYSFLSLVFPQGWCGTLEKTWRSLQIVGALHISRADVAWRYLIDSANIPLFRSADEAETGLVCSLCRKWKRWLTGRSCDVVHVTATKPLKKSTAFVVWEIIHSL